VRQSGAKKDGRVTADLKKFANGGKGRRADWPVKGWAEVIGKR